MIHESHFWQEDLARRAKSLGTRLSQSRWTERSHGRVEQDLMMGFYAIRKLIDSNKVTRALAKARVTLRTHRCRKPVTQMNRHAVHDLYDLDRFVTEKRDVVFVCNQFIHSYVFVPTFSLKRRMVGVLVSSDRERNRVAFHMPMSGILQVFAHVIDERPSMLVMTRNHRRGDFDVSASRGKPGVAISLIMDEPGDDPASSDTVGMMIKSALLRDQSTIYESELNGHARRDRRGVASADRGKRGK